MQRQLDEPIQLPWAHLRIPPFPSVAVRIMQLTNKEDVPMRQLSELISSEPAFSSEVITLANSALYACRVPITSVLGAIAVLGTNSLKGICLTIGVRAYLGDALNDQSLRSIWRHSLACALIANQLAAAGRRDRDTAYTAGIMHDIGRLALAVLSPQPYGALLQKHTGSPADALQAERELFGFDHCEAGLHLIADWKMPPYFQAVVADHHSARVSHDVWQMLDMIQLSCRMADTIGFSAFAKCEATPFADLLAEIPLRERNAFCADPEALAFEVASKINTLEFA